MTQIIIIGLGAGDIDQLPLGIYKRIRNAGESIYVRTMDHPAVGALQTEGITFHSFDHVYEEKEDFSSVYKEITGQLIEHARTKSVMYAVPGHPMLAEKTVQLLLEQDEVPVHIRGGQSYLDDLFTSLHIDPIEGFQFVDALSFDRDQLDYRHHLLFGQVYDRFVASDVKLMLLEDLPADHPVKVVEAVGSKQEKIATVPLKELDHMLEVNNLTSVYVPPVSPEYLHHTFTGLRDVISRLRAPDGCPWDRRQTHESLRQYIIEEGYELIDAIDEQDDEGIIEELGDVLLQVMLHSQIGDDNGYFSIDDVIKVITDKMIHRHPHVFRGQTAETVDEVNRNWDALKQEEKRNQRNSVLDGVPKHTPSLARAYQLQQKAGKVGFEWESVSGAWDKLTEEMAEVQQAVDQKDHEEVEKELGDVLFVLANVSRYYKVNPEIALNRTNQKFISRFSYVERKVKEENKSMDQADLEEMDRYWDEAKRKEG